MPLALIPLNILIYEKRKPLISEGGHILETIIRPPTESVGGQNFPTSSVELHLANHRAVLSTDSLDRISGQILSLRDDRA